MNNQIIFLMIHLLKRCYFDDFLIQFIHKKNKLPKFWYYLFQNQIQTKSKIKIIHIYQIKKYIYI